jgi:hypothetical protein
MKAYYRISDNSYVKEKIPGTSKEICLINFIKHFPNTEITIIADNCTDNTISMIAGITDAKLIRTNLNNASSFNYSLELALQNDLDCINYFVEDDYIHRDNTEDAIKEGLLKSDYVTLFDHPDKYESEYNYGEICKVFKTDNYRWRNTISTCMTFASKTSTLKKDFSTFKRNLINSHPNDHSIFKDLREKGRTLSLPMPGLAFHTDLTYQIQKSPVVENSLEKMVDHWVVDSVQKEIINLIYVKKNITLTPVEVPNYTTLMTLDVLLKS